MCRGFDDSAACDAYSNKLTAQQQSPLNLRNILRTTELTSKLKFLA